jgi:hypothetical protein
MTLKGKSHEILLSLLFYWRDMTFAIGPDQVYFFHFNDVFKLKFEKMCLAIKILHS